RVRAPGDLSIYVSSYGDRPRGCYDARDGNGEVQSEPHTTARNLRGRRGPESFGDAPLAPEEGRRAGRGVGCGRATSGYGPSAGRRDPVGQSHAGRVDRRDERRAHAASVGRPVGPLGRPPGAKPISGV